MSATKGLVLQGGDTARFVAGRWVFVAGLVVILVVLLEVVYEFDGFFKRGKVYASVHKQLLGAKHLGNFRKHRCTTNGHNVVGKHANKWVCRDTRKAIGATAL